MTQHIIDTVQLEKVLNKYEGTNGWASALCDDLRQLLANSPQADGMVNKPQKEGIFVWRNASAISLVYVSKRPSKVEVGGTLNAQVIDSSKFYDGCAIDKWLGGHWIEISENPMLSAYKQQADDVRKDAERYRWLKDNNQTDITICYWVDDSDESEGGYYSAIFVDEIDQAIDKARE